MILLLPIPPKATYFPWCSFPVTNAPHFFRSLATTPNLPAIRFSQTHSYTKHIYTVGQKQHQTQILSPPPKSQGYDLSIKTAALTPTPLGLFQNPCHPVKPPIIPRLPMPASMRQGHRSYKSLHGQNPLINHIAIMSGVIIRARLSGMVPDPRDRLGPYA